MATFNINAPSGREARLPLDALLEQSGRKGGGTTYGWHTFAERFQCWHKYYLSSILGVRRFSSPALAVGSILHEVLATWYTTPLHEDPSSEIARILRVCREGGYDKATDEAERLLEGYFYHWQPPTFNGDTWVPAEVVRNHKGDVQQRPDTFIAPGAEVLAVEQLLETDKPFNYTCRMDLAFRDNSGIWVVDHKTATALNDTVTDWSLQGEILGLLWLAQKKWGKDLKGLIINLIVKTKVPQYERLTFRLRPRAIALHLHSIRYLLKIQKIAEEMNWPRNFTACITQYGRCQFFDYCKNGSVSGLDHKGKLDVPVQGVPDGEDPPFGGGVEW